MTVDLQKYRTSTEYREILRILQKATNLEENLLWQSHALGKNIIPIQLLEIDFVAREVVVTIDADRYRIDPEIPVYIKLGYRTSVFKADKYSQSQHTLHFPLPNLIKTQELRSSPRHSFRPTEDKTVTLRTTLRSTVLGETGVELRVRVFDVSSQGLGLIVSESNRQFLKNNRILWVTELNELALEYPILAEVVYINTEVDAKFANRRQRDLKVGLKLSGVIPEESFRIFLK